MKKQYYTMISNNAIQTNTNKETGEIFESYTSKFGDKTLLILDYLHIHTNRIGTCKFTIQDMIKYCYCKERAGKGRTNEQFKEILIQLEKQGLIKSLDTDINKVKVGDLLVYNTEGLIEKDKDGDNYFFFIIHEETKETIFNVKEKGIDNHILFNIYCAIVSRMKQNRSGNGYEGNISYPSFIKIGQDTGVGDNIIHKYVEVLKNKELLVVGNAGTFYNKATNTYKNANNTYVLLPNNFAYEYLYDAISLFKSQMDQKGYVHVCVKNDNRKLGGEKGRLKAKINKGVATKRDVKKYEDICKELEKTKQDKVEVVNKEVIPQVTQSFCEKPEVEKPVQQVEEVQEEIETSSPEEPVIEEIEEENKEFVNPFGLKPSKDNEAEKYRSSKTIVITKEINKNEGTYEDDDYMDFGCPNNFDKLTPEEIEQMKKDEFLGSVCPSW